MDSLALPKMPLLPFSHSTNPSNPHRCLKTLRPKFSSYLAQKSLRSPRRLASISCSAALFGSGGGGGGDGLPGGRGGDGDGGGEKEAGSLAVGASDEVSNLGNDEDDVIILRVGGMSCGGCAASVKRILESQPQVSLATVNFEKETAFVWVVPEVKVTHNWQQELGEKLANHLTTCGFKSDLQEGNAPGNLIDENITRYFLIASIASAMHNNRSSSPIP